jgi:hypothetical protein
MGCDLGDIYPPADPVLDLCEDCMPKSDEATDER